MRSLRLSFAALLPFACLAQAPHAVVASTPDLAALCRSIGGTEVAVTCFVVGPQDPHYLDPRPAMLYAMQKAELVVQIGRDLESGWLPVLINNSRNAATQPGQIGHLDASRAVRALNVPTATTTRAAGDVHLSGNPHYLLDPLCGIEVAALLRDRFAALWPAGKATFVANFASFRERLAAAMVGPELAKLYEHDAEKLAQAFGNGTLLDVLKQQGDLGKLGGWFAAMAPLRGSQLVVDHDLWPYFAERFGCSIFGYLEPRPGMTPSTAHLTQLVERMRAASVRVVLASAYFPEQYAKTVQAAAAAVVVPMAHQPGARPGTDDYIPFVDHNVRALVSALTAKANG
jgi:ABC-type Zn uptake system ZnuABC Zn-binding protein ZnuA